MQTHESCKHFKRGTLIKALTGCGILQMPLIQDVSDSLSDLKSLLWALGSPMVQRPAVLL